MVLQKSSLVFKVRRNPPELVAPAGPTPHELKMLSDIDDQEGLRCHLPLVLFFRFHPSMAGKDPAQVIRQALAKALVFYYPFAGRLREGPSGKLMVDCTGEGVLFIEADADATLEQFGNDIQPPFLALTSSFTMFPVQMDYLIVHSYLLRFLEIIKRKILNAPIITRLKCGGFIFAMSMNHTITDGIGIVQFIKAIGEIARGAPKPSIVPVWCRELLCARNPPRVTCIHHEYQELPLDNKSIFTPYHASFFFGPKEIAAMRRLLPHHLAHSPSFEVLTACLWRCRTAALQWQNPDQEVRLLCIVNARFEPCRLNPPLPKGFYGNALVCPAAVSTVGKLCGSPLGYALELVKKAKAEASKEYVHSVVDLMAIKGRPCFTRTGSFMVSDLTKSGSKDVDYGWGKAVYFGLAKAGLGDSPGVSYYVPYTNSKGEQGRVVPICLPEEAMERFEKELDGILKIKDEEPMMLMSNL